MRRFIRSVAIGRGGKDLYTVYNPKTARGHACEKSKVKRVTGKAVISCPQNQIILAAAAEDVLVQGGRNPL